MPKNKKVAICKLCGEPMPEGEEMFKFHGYSGPCLKPPLSTINIHTAELILDDEGNKCWKMISDDFMDEVISDEADLFISADNFPVGTVITINEPSE